MQFPRKPEKWHNSSYHTTTGDYIVIICCLYPDGRRIFDRTAETTFVLVVLSLRLLGLVFSESRVPSISFLGGIFTRWVAPVSVQGRRILLVPVMVANTVDYDIKPPMTSRNPGRKADRLLHPAHRLTRKLAKGTSRLTSPAGRGYPYYRYPR